MLIITNTRIVGLIAVVCAAVVAPQALAATNTHNTVPQPGDPTHNTVSPPGDPSDVIQRYQLRGELSDQGLAPTAFAAVPSQSPMGQPANNTPGGFDLGDLKEWAGCVDGSHAQEHHGGFDGRRHQGSSASKR